MDHEFLEKGICLKKILEKSWQFVSLWEYEQIIHPLYFLPENYIFLNIKMSGNPVVRIVNITNNMYCV